MITINRQMVPKTVANRVTYGNGNGKRFITVHQTGNIRRGADAQMHARLQFRGNSRSASWHYQVDEKDIIQSFEDSAQCWHAGDGRGNGNLNSIAIELCINSDGDYRKTIKNGAALVNHLMEKYNLSINDVKQHYNWSGKNCPAQIRANKDGINWADFLNMAEGKTVEPKSQVKSTYTTNNITVDGKWGSNTTRALQKALGTPQDGILSNQLRNSVTTVLYGGVNWGRGGSLVIEALQRKVNSKSDGYLGPNTVGALQNYLGTPYDNKLSRPSLVVEEMQKRLNAGTF